VPIEWSKLRPYKHDRRRSFEELCYQIARAEYSHLGSFTSIDDSGGGDGVEFYLTLPNGDEWGWQAKFYFPDARLTSGRRSKIIQSLRVSISKHPSLKKWFLCTPTSLSPKGNHGELAWFESDLHNIAGPVELVHWGESDLLDFLKKPGLSGAKAFFFGDLELSEGWFKGQVAKQIANIGDKFIEQLHTSRPLDNQVHDVIGDEKFVASLRENMAAALTFMRDIEDESSRKLAGVQPNSEWKSVVDRLTVALNRTLASLRATISSISSVAADVEKGDFQSATTTDIECNKEAFSSACADYYRICQEAENSITSQTEPDPPSAASRNDPTVNRFESVLAKSDTALSALWSASRAVEDFKRGYLHVLADAGFGKTHLTAYIASSRVARDLPTILLLGEQFGKDMTIEGRIRQICDIPPEYSWDQFINALEACATAWRSRVVILIDALNEAVPVDIWRQQLAGFMTSVMGRGRIAVITTTRSSYREQIWGTSNQLGLTYLRGFDQSLHEAVDRYFRYFKIAADFTFDSIDQFRNPLYLRIFCEAVNREMQVERKIFVGQQYAVSMFETFLERRNESFSRRAGKPAAAKLLQKLLQKFARQLWEQNARHLTLEGTVQLLEGSALESLQWESSLTKALLNEELLVSRDVAQSGETVSFTYDLLGGYLIADYLLSANSTSAIEFTKSPAFVASLTDKDYRNRHPLHSDILRCYQLLLPARTGQHLYRMGIEPFYSEGISAIFEVDPTYITNDEIDEIIRLFRHPDNRKPLLEMLRGTALVTTHPLSARFSSRLLYGLQMRERDVSWSELLRKRPGVFQEVVDGLYKTCRSRGLGGHSGNRLALVATYVAWMLTSTNRELRDSATRALYWYGRKFPASLSRLTLSSLRVNDPYVSERMLAAAYGVCMALHCRPKRHHFRTKILPALARHLFDAMFAPESPHSTTHALSRDFARRIIQLAQLHHTSVLTSTEQQRTIPPFKDGGIRQWQTMEDPNDEKYREGNAPLGMDFENYTIGRLVPGRQNYDSKNKEYKKVVEQIIWRIYQLGYSLETFGEIDKDIARWSGYSRSDRPRAERYGKKYSWIAFFEQYGFRRDQGLLKDRWDEGAERPSDIDIDPSFPDEPRKLRVIENILGDRSGDLREWVQEGPTPEFRPYLLQQQVDRMKGPWVLLDGHCSQRDDKAERIGFVALQSFLLLKEDEEEFVRLIGKEKPRGRWLPEEEEDHYTFLGEVPWCDTFPNSLIDSVDFVVGKTRVRVAPNDPRYTLRFILDFGGSKRTIEPQERPEFEEVNVSRKVPVYIPVRKNGFSTTGAISRGSGNVPTKEFAELFRLWVNLPAWDMCDQNGRICSILTEEGGLGDFESHLYLRQELIDQLLSSQALSLVWVAWGERQHFSSRHAMTTAPSHGYRYFQQVYLYRGGRAEWVG
jgi:hypothetical protein